MTEILDRLIKWAEGTRYWSLVQPFLLIGSAFVATEVFAYGYIGSQHGYHPSLATFARSYLFFQILIAYACLFFIAVGFVLTGRAAAGTVGRLRAYLAARQGATVVRSLILMLGATAAVLGIVALMPSQASHIRIVFLDPPAEVRKDAFAYLIYELNRLQRSWYFEIEYQELNPAVLSGAAAKACEDRPDRTLCLANAFHALHGEASKDEQDVPMIAITSNGLRNTANEDVFFSARHPFEPVAVISTFDKDGYSPLTAYEYLMYWVLIQTISMHLEQHGGEPQDSFAAGTVSRGGVFEYTSEVATLKSTILAARLNPAQEQLLFNRFGPEYVSTCASLLSFEWLYSARTSGNLSHVFGVELTGLTNGGAP